MRSSLPDPTVDIRPPVPDVLSDPKAQGALPSVSPRVQGPYGQLEELGELFHGGKAIVVVHPFIIEVDSVAQVSWESRSMAAATQTALLAVTGAEQGVFGQLEGI